MTKTLITLAAVAALSACAPPAAQNGPPPVQHDAISGEPVKVATVEGFDVYSLCASNRVIYVTDTGVVSTSDMWCS